MYYVHDLSVALIASVVGFVCGYLMRGHLGSKLDGASGASFILLIVACAWALSVIFDIASPTYETPIAIHGLMGLIVGFFYKNKNETDK